jgi:hypothetical protein
VAVFLCVLGKVMEPVGCVNHAFEGMHPRMRHVPPARSPSTMMVERPS